MVPFMSELMAFKNADVYITFPPEFHKKARFLRIFSSNPVIMGEESCYKIQIR